MNLGGLENLPGCRELLIRKHTAEVERVMRLWRALVQQMRGQVKEDLRDVDSQAWCALSPALFFCCWCHDHA